MSAIGPEIESQPQAWAEAAARARALDGILPPPGARVAVLGCGTSFYIAQAYAAARESAGCGETDAFVASERPGTRRHDLAIAISRSGTTTEVLRALETLPTGTPSVAITAVADGPIMGAAGRSIVRSEE